MKHFDFPTTLLQYPHGKYKLRIDKWINKQIEFSYEIADFYTRVAY